MHPSEPVLPPPPDAAAIGSLRHSHRWQTDRYPCLVPTALAQHGVLSREQIAALGIGQGRIEHEIAAGRWRATTPLVVALHNGRLDRDQVLWAAVLHAGPGPRSATSRHASSPGCAGRPSHWCT